MLSELKTVPSSDHVWFCLTRTTRAAEFANASAKAPFVTADGMWLNDPVAVVRATSGDKPVSALLRLSAPSYDSASNVLTFKVRRLLLADRAV